MSWTDRSTNETAFLVQKSTDGGTTWADVGTVSRLFLDPLNAVLLDPVPLPNTAGDTVTFTDPAIGGGCASIAWSPRTPWATRGTTRTRT